MHQSFFFFQGFPRVADDTKWLAFQQLVQAFVFGWFLGGEHGGTTSDLGALLLGHFCLTPTRC
jgi:hypothetical protein